MTTDFRALCKELTDDLEEWVKGYLISDHPNECTAESPERIARARAALASSPDQDDVTLRSIREHTPRYRMTVIISTNDACIDTRMHVIWSALDSGTEILESVSLPEKLSPYGNP